MAQSLGFSKRCGNACPCGGQIDFDDILCTQMTLQGLRQGSANSRMLFARRNEELDKKLFASCHS